MKASTLPLLACPTCHGALVQDTAPEGPTITSGSLCCPRCRRDYRVVDGIPRFVEQQALTGLNRRFARLYDWFSYVYAPYSRLMFTFLGGEVRNRREVLDRLEHPAAGGRVLEVSIGPGVNLPYLVGAPGVAEIYGLDISPGQLRQCQRLCRRRGWPVDLFLGNAEQLPFKEDTFDCVFHIGGINFFNDKRAAIAEMIRVARAGTKIVVVDEHERAARLYERTLPGFRSSFRGIRPAVTAPVELVPANVDAVSLTSVWRGWFYCLEFRKPSVRFMA
jgi:ubiquinone/menaquinone biosynthesis C-methylase UbiE